MRHDRIGNRIKPFEGDLMNQVLKIRGLKFTYPDGTPALRGMNLDVMEGESVGFIGPNGAGKTTLLLHLNGLLKGDGEVEVMGRSVTDENLDFIRTQVGFVFQNPEDQLFMPTVFDDVAFGPINMGFSKEDVRELLGKHAGEEAEDPTDKAQKPRYDYSTNQHLDFSQWMDQLFSNWKKLPDK